MEEESLDIILVIAAGICVSFLFILSIMVFMLINLKRKTENERRVEKVKSEFEYQLMGSRIEIQEQTFKQISQEIHDNIGQMLTLVKLHLNSLEKYVQPPGLLIINDAQEGLTKTIQDLRDISKTLNSDMINQIGIVKAIGIELKVLEKLTIIKTECKCEDEHFNIDPQVELILFRIVQESLHNIIKHAKATAVYVSTGIKDNCLKLIIEDNGVGFNTNDKSILGNGLMNIKSRCKLINAEVFIESVVFQGTSIELTVPIDINAF